MPDAFRRFPQLDEAWSHSSPAERVRSLRQAGPAIREALEKEGPVAALATCPLVTFPYPTQFAFSGGALSPAPYLMMTNRMMVVQFETDQGRKTLLFNPSDYERGLKAPFYWTLRQKYGDFLADKILSKRYASVPDYLHRLGLRPEDVDYIGYDHLHVQDVRGWLGGTGAVAFFPRAKLLVERREWEGAKDLHPMQRVWYVPDGTAGVPEDRVVLLGGDARLGKGVAILSTPGHTMGNMSLAVCTDRGVFVTSENGVATESYTPEECGIPGVRRHAEQMGWEVVLNGNTRESSLEQYASMVLEKAVAGPSRVDPRYVNFYPSSELTPAALAPGIPLTFSHGDLSCGVVQATRRAA